MLQSNYNPAIAIFDHSLTSKLISVNPFRDLGIYTESVLESYKGKNRLEVCWNFVAMQCTLC